MIVFPPFVLDLRSGRLLRGDEALPVRPKTYAVLRYLAERPDVLVTKEELFSQLWAGTAIGDDSLTKSIREIRAVLADDVKRPRFIETVHRRGFRFVARVDGRPQPDGWAGEPEGRWADPAPHLVGRAVEMNRLDALYRRAADGRRQIVFVTGEPGIGKTTLVETFLERLGRRPGSESRLVASGWSVEQTGPREAYLPVLTALERLGRSPHAARVVALMRRYAPTWLAQMPWLVEPEEAATLTNLLDIKAERMLRELCTFVEALTETHALVLVLEDLHWSDAATVELLEMLGQRQEPARLLVVGTCRPAEMVVHAHPLLQAKQTLLQRKRCTEIRLDYLSGADVQEYIARRFPGCPQDAELASLIHQHTDGSPLFMTAALDDLIARAWLVDTAPGWALSISVAKADLGVPDDLRQMIAMQLQALECDDRRLLELASVAGVEFAAPAVAGALNLDVAEVEAACERLVRSHRFLRVAGTAEWAEGMAVRRYAFIHALHRHVVYDTIPETRRRKAHQGVGEAIEAAYGAHATDRATELAAHFESSRDLTRAVKYLSEAAQRLQRRFATREAIACLERAIEFTTRLPRSAPRNRTEMELRFLLRPALSSLYGYASEAARENGERIRVLCEDVGSAEELYHAHYALWHSQAARVETGAAETSERMAQLAAALGNAELRAHADVIRGRTLFWQSRFTEAQQVLRGVIGFWDRQPGIGSEPAWLEPPGIAVYSYDSVVHWFLGYPARARDRIREALAIAQDADHPFVLAGTLLHAAYIVQLWRDDREVELLARRTLDLAEQHDFPFWKSMAHGLLGWALAHRGEAKQGAGLIEDALTQQRASGARALRSHMLAFLAFAHLRAGDCRAGLDAVEEGLALCETTIDRVFEPELWRLKGELLLQRIAGRSAKRPGLAPAASASSHSVVATRAGIDASEAERCFQRALEIASQRSARSLELRAATSLARLLRDQGKRAEARHLLGPIYSWFSEGFDTADLREAKTLLE